MINMQISEARVAQTIRSTKSKTELFRDPFQYLIFFTYSFVFVSAQVLRPKEGWSKHVHNVTASCSRFNAVENRWASRTWNIEPNQYQYQYQWFITLSGSRNTSATRPNTRVTWSISSFKYVLYTGTVMLTVIIY